MSDLKYFTSTKKGEIPELKEELISSDKKRKTAAMKKIIANMTMGNDMSSLFPDVLGCIQSPSLDLKKMVYLYLVNYAKAKQEMALLTVNSFIRDTEDLNPLIRGLAIRTMSYIEVDKISEAMAGPLRKCLKDADPYVRKTAALCVGKLYKHEPKLVEDEGFLDILKEMMNDANTTVVANVLVTLAEIDQIKDEGVGIHLDFSTVMKFLTALNESSEWGQVYIMEALMMYTPNDANEAETIAERVAPRLNHANSAVILSAIKLIVHCFSFLGNDSLAGFVKRISASLVTLLRSGVSEIQYVALRNTLLLMQKFPDLLAKEMKVFFCEYNDPIYVKLAKLEILMRIANDSNVEQILSELKEYSSEIDVDFVRKAVRAIGICAVKIERASDRCIEVLLELIQTKVNYVVQEAIVVIKNIFRKYPNRYESIIGTLCENLDTLDEPDAKASMIWIIGQYSDRIDNADDLLSSFLDSFLEEPSDVQLSILTAVVKLFLHRPNSAQEMIKKMFKWATEQVDNPDLRDRAFIYWRLLSFDPASAKAVVMAHKSLSNEGTIEQLEPNILNEVLHHIGSLASIYHKPPSAFLDVKAKPLPEQPISAAKTITAIPDTKPANSMQILGGGEGGLMGIPMGRGMGMQASVGGGVGNVMNLLDLDLDEPQAETSQSQSNLEDVMESLGLGGAGAGAGAMNTLSSAPVGGGGGVSSQGGLGDILGLGGFGGGGAAANPASIFNLNLVEQSLVRPKQVMLPAKNAQGLEIHGTFARRQGKLYLDLTFYNKAMQPMSDLAFQFNKNSFGICPAETLQVRSPLPPNTSHETSLLLTYTTAQRAIKDPINLLQIAVKNNVSVFYFQTLIHGHVLFSEDGSVEKSEYLRLWREIPETNEHTFSVSNLRFPNIEALRSKLSRNNVFTVAERQVEDRTLLYCSTSLLPDKLLFLLELTLDASLATASCATKTYSMEYIAVFEESLGAILHSE